MNSLCRLLTLLVVAQVSGPPSDIGKQIISAGNLSRQAARLVRIDAVSRPPAVRRDLISIAKSLSGMSTTMADCSKLVR